MNRTHTHFVDERGFACQKRVVFDRGLGIYGVPYTLQPRVTDGHNAIFFKQLSFKDLKCREIYAKRGIPARGREGAASKLKLSGFAHQTVYKRFTGAKKGKRLKSAGKALPDPLEKCIQLRIHHWGHQHR
jgi:hypothetical protein